MKCTDAQWARIEPLIASPPKRPDRRGRPRRADRKILEAILWILHTGAPWAKLPAHFPPKSTCHDRFQEWNQNGTLQRTAGRRTSPTGQAQAFGVLYRCLLCCG